MRFKVIALLEKKLWQLTAGNGAKSPPLPGIGNSKSIFFQCHLNIKVMMKLSPH